MSFFRILHEWPEGAARAAIVIVAIFLAWLTWAHWGDIQIDCGRELYVPSEILRGKLLYRDIWYPYGPLAPYAQATLLSCFGPHLSAFYLFGLATAIAISLMLLEIGTMLAGREVGLAVAFVPLFEGFRPSIFNYIFPYSYGATLGLSLSLACALFVLRYVLGGTQRNLMFAGLAAGLAMLCKLEMGFSCYAMLGFLLAADACIRPSPRLLRREGALLIPGLVLWISVYGWFFWILTPKFMLTANLTGVPGTYTMKTYTSGLYTQAGFRFDPSEVAFLITNAAIALVLWALIARATHDRSGRALVIAVSLLAVTLLVIRCLAPTALADSLELYLILLIIILIFPNGMFFIACGALFCAIYKLWVMPTQRRNLAEATFAIYALATAFRVLSQIVPLGYPIYYATPLFVVFLVTLAKCIRRSVSALEIQRPQTLVNWVLAVDVVLFGVALIPVADGRMQRLKTSWGEIYVRPEDAGAATQILEFMAEQKPNGRQVTILPEGPMFYALNGTEAPSRWYTLLPGLVSPAQEGDYIKDLEHARPEYLVLTNRYAGEYGAAYFGIDYGQSIYQWIEANYKVARQFGSFRRDGSKVLTALLFQRRAPARNVFPRLRETRTP